MKKLILVCTGIAALAATHSATFAAPKRTLASHLSPEALDAFQEVQSTCKALTNAEFSMDVYSIPAEIPPEHLVLEFKAKDRSIQLRPRIQSDLDRGFKQDENFDSDKVTQEARSTMVNFMGFRMPGKNKPTKECIKTMTHAVAYLYHARVNHFIESKAVSDLHDSGKIIPEAVSITEPATGSTDAGAGK